MLTSLYAWYNWHHIHRALYIHQELLSLMGLLPDIAVAIILMDRTWFLCFYGLKTKPIYSLQFDRKTRPPTHPPRIGSSPSRHFFRLVSNLADNHWISIFSKTCCICLFLFQIKAMHTDLYLNSWSYHHPAKLCVGIDDFGASAPDCWQGTRPYFIVSTVGLYLSSPCSCGVTDLHVLEWLP